ncbi:hypothetical protein SAY87_015489 [Trapa incisa]|uniref:Uncharacterized protein n=1 Tax=Trapa incisa TaxID=236973 RepID=A0AAN7GR38_9MYRT|nr:hypothetical protein SAY87_015489 [Trapa incisa]
MKLLLCSGGGRNCSLQSLSCVGKRKLENLWICETLSLPLSLSLFMVDPLGAYLKAMWPMTYYVERCHGGRGLPGVYRIKRDPLYHTFIKPERRKGFGRF